MGANIDSQTVEAVNHASVNDGNTVYESTSIHHAQYSNTYMENHNEREEGITPADHSQPQDDIKEHEAKVAHGNPNESKISKKSRINHNSKPAEKEPSRFYFYKSKPI